MLSYKLTLVYLILSQNFELYYPIKSSNKKVSWILYLLKNNNRICKNLFCFIRFLIFSIVIMLLLFSIYLIILKAYLLFKFYPVIYI